MQYLNIFAVEQNIYQVWNIPHQVYLIQWSFINHCQSMLWSGRLSQSKYALFLLN